ncbi:MAG: hypothetical protein ACXADW_09150 [Candidatus Hodarchaeales archaeon]|jgi:glycosyltransferase involved in cell wall biosynthesis
MKIVLSTSQPNAAASMFYMGAFSGIDKIDFQKNNYQDYDIALFMTYDHQTIKSVREKYPHLKIGIIDPRNYKVFESTKYCDFIIIDSIEMEDFWRASSKPIFRYVEYPNIPYVSKTHKDKDTITIGYHGNQIHLKCMSQNVTPALNLLSKKYNLELLVMGGGPPLSKSDSWYPKNMAVRHVPWSMDNYLNELGKCDIGIVPNNLIHNDTVPEDPQNFNYSLDDYSLRFKMPSNPGRFVIFGILNIPVVADFYPSAIQYLQGDCGFVAHSVAGWHHSLEQLITSSELRQKTSDNLQNLVKSQFNFENQNKKLVSFLETMI